MSSKLPKGVEDSLIDIDNSWEEEIERLKREIKRAEERILVSEQSQLAEKAKFMRGSDAQGDDLLGSAAPMDVFSSPLVERVIRGRKLSARPDDPEALGSPGKAAKEPPGGIWASPLAAVPLRDPFPARLESSFDGSSVISLDFGLVSPGKNWCSPPQRIERAQNREWSSPHRVIDRPNPENSPGNWISMKESCAAARHSPTLEVQSEPLKAPFFCCPEPQSRPMSQSTYVVQEASAALEMPAKDDQPTSKVSVLENYEPERVISTKKRAGDRGDAVERNLLPTKEKIRKVVTPGGHVVKISLLGDFEAPAFGRIHERISETTETDCVAPLDKTVKGTTKRARENSNRSLTSKVKSQAKKKKEEKKKDGGISGRNQSVDDEGIPSNENEEEENAKEKENKRNDLEKSTLDVIHNLEEILRSSKVDTGKTAPALLKNTKVEKSKPKKLKTEADPIAEKTPEAVEKKKRAVDSKAVREYIKSQKQKRMAQVKMEKKTKDAEREARKKKLEELRIKTLKLASQSKKKKSPQTAEKVAGAATQEDDVTMSLGLKQVTPKVSYNESISKLKNKTRHLKLELPRLELECEENFPETLPCEDDGGDKTLEEVEIIEPEANRPDDLDLNKVKESADSTTENDLKETLKKLSESLHVKLNEKEKEVRTRPPPLSAKESSSRVQNQETSRTVKSTPEENRQMITVDMETIKTLKSDIKKISENFKVLHEIITEKGDLSGRGSLGQRHSSTKSRPAKPQQPEDSDWPKSLPPAAYPYNVYNAFQKKMNLKTRKPLSSASQGSCTLDEHFSNKLESEFEELSVPSDRLRSSKEMIGSFRSTSCNTLEENYFSMKDDSGSELSSSILDSEKQSIGSDKHLSNSSSKHTGRKDSLSSSIITEITSRSVQMTHSKSSHLKSSCRRVDSGRGNLTLVTPDVKLVPTEPQERNSHPKILHQTASECLPEEVNNSERTYKEKSDSTIGELIDNLSENEGSARSSKQKENRGIPQAREEVHSRRSFFQPEMLHLQFQAELTLLETFQQSLSQFLQAERMKTLSEANKIVFEKAVNTEKLLDKEDRSMQVSCIKEGSGKSTSGETDSVKTEINAAESSNRADSPKTEQDLISELTEKLTASSKETSKDEKPKSLENSDFGSDGTGISLQLLKDTMKDEELRSERLMALIRLREKTLNEKVKAELTFLEMKKRALKDRGGDEDQNISAIKKKQRGILLKYQSEKEDIDRLKRTHKMAAEDRKKVLKRQKQIQQMQFSDSDMVIRLKKREKSAQKKAPLKPKALNFHGHVEHPERFPGASDSMFSESICSADESKHSSRSDFDLSPGSNFSKDGESPKPNLKPSKSKVFSKLENLKSKKCQLEVERYPRKQHSVEELLSWTKRLEEKENHLRELEKQAVSAAIKAKSRLAKTLKSTKTSTKDRSTSPFQVQDGLRTPSEVSPPEATETKKSTTISEAIEVANTNTEGTEKTESVAEKFQSSVTEDIPEQLSKKILTSRSTEYQSESFESPSSSETAKNKMEAGRKCEWGHKGIAIKMSLSPRMQSPRRRYSSGSDDSVNLSHTETASEQSDLESRIAALHEQLRKRKLEAERLRREQKKAQRQRLRVKEQCLLNQIQAYDAYIQKKKQELEREYEYSNQAVMKPLIKQPKVAEKPRGSSVLAIQYEKLMPHARPEAKVVEKDEIVEKTPEKESDSEVVEQIKPESGREATDDSDSIKEQIESKLEEEEKTETTENVERSHDGGKSTSLSESLPEKDTQEGSQSESEDQSVSIKTTLQSPERQDTEAIRTQTETEETTRKKETTEEEEDSYRLDSFESDAEEKETIPSEVPQELSDPSEGKTEFGGESAIEENVDSHLEEEKSSERAGKAEKIANSIIMGLILESLNVFCSKKVEEEKKLAEESRLGMEMLSNFLAGEIISEAVEDMVRIYKRKASLEKAGTPQTTPPQKGATRGHQITKTSSDVSPSDEAAEESGEIFLHSLSLLRKDKPEEQEGNIHVVVTGDMLCHLGGVHLLKLSSIGRTAKSQVPTKEVFTDEECNGHEPRQETFGQEWSDDEFGLSQTRKEAEELRLQQLQIEQEIEQLQAQQKQVPYFYLREIPNKPPPPYTPPAKPFTEIPTSEAEIMRITLSAVRILADEMNGGKPVSEVEPDADYYGDAASENFKCYKLFLFDLAKHIVSDLLEQQREAKEEVLPWMRTRKRLSRYKYQKIERTLASLNDFVQRQVFVLFGFGRKVSKESLIVRWIKKRRDHVDEILVGESQEEESQWTQYDEDQVAVKNEVTLSILDSLLEDTARVLNAIFNNKTKKERRNCFAP